MAEIQLSKAILFDKGYVLQSSTSLMVNVTYFLRIQSNNSTYDRIYTPKYSGNTILDTWGTLSIPEGSDVCFTLTDKLPCEIPPCDIIITGGT